MESPVWNIVQAKRILFKKIQNKKWELRLRCPFPQPASSQPAHYLKRFYNIACRAIYPLSNRIPPLGQCFPGQRKLFVNTIGNFFMCEKVRGNLRIGNVNDGFDYETIYRFYREYDRFFSLCGECWALRLCNKCFNTIRKGEQLDEERRNHR
jgi:radical SAM protein with 4Fe4S-binding SPASM domain